MAEHSQDIARMSRMRSSCDADIVNLVNAAPLDEGDNLEIEVRIHHGKPGDLRSMAKYDIIGLAKRVIDRYGAGAESPHVATEGSGTKSLSETINFITIIPKGAEIKELVFRNGVQIPEAKQYYRKLQFLPSRIAREHGEIPATKMSFNIERIIPAFVKPVKLVRAKLRLSMIPPESDPMSLWRIDVTLTATEQSTDPTILQQIKKDLFQRGVTAETFAHAAPWDKFDVEIELERLTRKSFSIADFDVFDRLVAACARTDYILPTIARIIDPRGTGYDVECGTPDFKLKFRNLCNQVFELNSTIFREKLEDKLAAHNILVTNKADGARCMVVFADRKIAATIITATQCISMPRAIDDGDDLAGTIIDGEYIDGTVWAFDILARSGENVIDEPFESRLRMMRALEEKLPEFVRIKPFMEPDEKSISALLAEDRYELDGLIFVTKDAGYLDTYNFKWKPADRLTIDMLLRECPGSITGIEPYIPRAGYKMFLLFVYIKSAMFRKFRMRHPPWYRQLFPESDSDYFPVLFTPSMRHLGSRAYQSYLCWIPDSRNARNGEIAEMHFSDGNWAYYRSRPDKEIANNFRIAENIWQAYSNPLTLDQILGKTRVTEYFAETDVPEYRAQRAFNSFVKSQLISSHKATEALDICTGKGQDLMRYYGTVDNLICIERDHAAVDELVNRKYSIMTGKFKHRTERISINILVADMSLPHARLIKGLAGIININGAPLVVCNLAIHYFLATVESTNNFVDFISGVLAVGGTFIYTAFDGNAVFRLLREHDGKWQITDDSKKTRYGIIAKYSARTLQSCGQEISVKLPFTANAYYSEYLVNHAYLCGLFARCKITCARHESFAALFDEFATAQPDKFAQLSATDRQFIGLYHFAIFTKK